MHDMKRFFERIPLPVKLILIGSIPLVFVVYLTVQLYAEKSQKVDLLSTYIERIQQSSDISKLIGSLQAERDYSYEYALKKDLQTEIFLQRPHTDSLLKKLSVYGHDLTDFTSYTFLNDLDSVRIKIDSSKYAANQVMHYYTTIIFRLNTLNPVPMGARIYIPEVYDDMVSEKLVAEMITYLGISCTNVYSALYTHAYMVETLVGTLGTWQIYNTYEKELLVKGSPSSIQVYKNLRATAPLKPTVEYLDKLFKTFHFDSTYDHRDWRKISGDALDSLRQLQNGLAENVATSINQFYQKEKDAKKQALISLVIVLLVVFSIVTYSIYSINDTLLKLKKGAERISSGAVGMELNVESDDVIGSLTRSINKIDENNRVLARAADAIGKGDFETPVKSRSQEDVLGNAIGSMQKDLQQFTRQLEESEKRNRQLLQALPSAVYTFDANGYIQIYNEAAVALWGRRPTPGKERWNGAWKIFHPGGTIMQPEDYTMPVFVKDNQPSSDEEILIERPDGSRRIVLSRPQAIYDASGNITGGINILIDITDRKSVEKDIANLAAIVQSSADAIISKTLDSIVTSWNPGAERLFGYTAEEMIGEPILRLLPPDRLNEETQIIERIRHGERVEHFDTIRMTKNGELIDISLTISPIKNSKGEVIGASKVARDISYAVKARRAIEESGERTRLAIEAAKMGTFDWDLITNNFTSSQRLNDIFGYKDLPGITHKHLIEAFHPEDKPVRDKAVAEAPEKGSLRYEVRIYWPDKSIHWVKVFGKIVYDDKQRPLRMYGTVVDTTEEKTILKTLEENEQRLNLAMDAVELATWELNLVTGEAVYSERYLEILGFEPDARPAHKEILEKIHPDDLPGRNEAISNALRRGVLDFEMRILPGKENVRWIRARGKVFYDEKNIPQRMLGTALDITEEKIAYSVLQESEERFKTIANTAPVMIWMSGQDKFSDFFNISWLTFTGRTIMEESGEGWLEGVHPEDVQKCIELYQESHKKQKAFCVEYRLRRHDGKYRWISDNAVPRVTPEGEFIGFISACRDIDDEKRFNEKLRESELLFKTITNVSPVGLWMTDENGKNNFVNDTWIDWTGVDSDTKTGGDWSDAVIVADKEYVHKRFQHSIEGKENFSAEFRIKRRDGEVRWVLSEGGPYYDIDGRFAGYAGSVADITERKQDEIRKNEFLAVASHELKTPLTSVKAYAQLLAKMYDKPGDVFLKNALIKMENQVNKMTKLVGDFLNLSKIESDKLQLSQEIFVMNELVDEIAADMQLVSLNHSIVVEKAAPIKVRADREKISQVITNFLTNAVKYSPLDKNIILSLASDNGSVKVSVSDNGIGIKPEEHDKIFERFYRSRFNNNISYSGFGIGLYISAEIIRRHDGKIGVLSNEGKGSTFYFALPVVR
jgi:PAS domain S-box-containing protein